MLYSVSHTTRKARRGERDGVDYFFIDVDEFKAGIAAGRWAEWALVHGNYYGTSVSFIDAGLAAGRDILLDIDVQGAKQIKPKYPESIPIFIMPPSLETLHERLQKRATDSQTSIARRVADSEKEMAQRHLYRHWIVNDDLPTAIAELVTIIARYR